MALRRKRLNDLGFVLLLMAATLGLYLGIQAYRDHGQGDSGSTRGSVQSVALPNLDAVNASQLDQTIASLQSRLEQDPSDGGSLARLGLAYLQKGRETADPGYYGKAEQALSKSFGLDAHNYESLAGLGALALSRHDFMGALKWGTLAVAENPYAAAVYGVLTDALVETGAYPSAVNAAQMMVDLRPDLSSYARVAYLRELHGDTEGAIDAMRQAVNAGSGSREGVAWTAVELGNLLFNRGDLDGATTEYERALSTSSDYPRALGGLARIAAARGDFAAAISGYKQAIAVIPLPELVIALGDVYEAAGMPADAAKQYDLVGILQKLQADNGVNTDLELAVFDLDHGLNVAAALDRVQQSYAVRKSVYGADGLAWGLYKNGRCEEAAGYSREALRLGTRDAMLHFHAGMIADCLGQPAKAASEFQRALTINPHFSLQFVPVAQERLTALEAGK